MISIHCEQPATGPIVTGFVGDRFRVDDQIYSGRLWLTPDDARTWDASSVDALDPTAPEPLLTITPQPEFLLLGTGARLRRPPPSVIAAIEAFERYCQVVVCRLRSVWYRVLRPPFQRCNRSKG